MGLDLRTPPGDTQLLAQNCDLQQPPNMATHRGSWGVGPAGPSCPPQRIWTPGEAPAGKTQLPAAHTVSGALGACLKPLDQGTRQKAT